MEELPLLWGMLELGRLQLPHFQTNGLWKAQLKQFTAHSDLVEEYALELLLLFFIFFPR